MVAEHAVTPADLIWPLFICEGRAPKNDREPPCVSALVGGPHRASEGGARPRHSCIACFRTPRRACASDDAREALNADNLICRAVKAAKDAAPEVAC